MVILGAGAVRGRCRPAARRAAAGQARNAAGASCPTLADEALEGLKRRESGLEVAVEAVQETSQVQASAQAVLHSAQGSVATFVVKQTLLHGRTLGGDAGNAGERTGAAGATAATSAAAAPARARSRRSRPTRRRPHYHRCRRRKGSCCCCDSYRQPVPRMQNRQRGRRSDRSPLGTGRDNTGCRRSRSRRRTGESRRSRSPHCSWPARSGRSCKCRHRIRCRCNRHRCPLLRHRCLQWHHRCPRSHLPSHRRSRPESCLRCHCHRREPVQSRWCSCLRRPPPL